MNDAVVCRTRPYSYERYAGVCVCVCGLFPSSSKNTTRRGIVTTQTQRTIAKRAFLTACSRRTNEQTNSTVFQAHQIRFQTRYVHIRRLDSTRTRTPSGTRNDRKYGIRPPPPRSRKIITRLLTLDLEVFFLVCLLCLFSTTLSASAN